MRRPIRVCAGVWMWMLCALAVFAALVGAVAGAQEVTLPLTQYEELRNRANPVPEASNTARAVAPRFSYVLLVGVALRRARRDGVL